MLLEGCRLLHLLSSLLIALLLPLQRLQLELQLRRLKHGSTVRLWCVTGGEAVEHGLGCTVQWSQCGGQCDSWSFVGSNLGAAQGVEVGVLLLSGGLLLLATASTEKYMAQQWLGWLLTLQIPLPGQCTGGELQEASRSMECLPVVDPL